MLRQLDTAIATSQARTGVVADAVEQRQSLDRAPTEDEARQFALLLRSGVPQYDALCYLVGAVTPDLALVVLTRWLREPVVTSALATLNGARWPDLSPEQRIDIALDKHRAEMAHYLYTNDFQHAEGTSLKKMEMARESLAAFRAGREEQQSPFSKFIAGLLAGQVAVVPTKALAPGERPSVLGMADVEPAIDGTVAETAEQE